MGYLYVRITSRKNGVPMPCESGTCHLVCSAGSISSENTGSCMGLWNTLTLGKTGYREHPETKRWVGRLAALFKRHDALVAEMTKRGYQHRSPLDQHLATGSDTQDMLLDTLDDQFRMLVEKPCPCPVDSWS